MAMMDELKIENRGKYLYFEFSGDFKVSTGKECVDEMLEACTQHQCSCALLDCRKMTGEMSVIDRFTVIDYGKKMRGIIKRIAILGRGDQVLPDRFAENVGVNRGLGLRIFTHADQATSWLEE